MTEEAIVTIAEIRALVSERQRFDEWLSALDARKADTPARVFERVRGDYVGRRDAVITSLHSHVGTLESLERDLSTRLNALETQLVEREDERAEAMLRTAVGEFDSERWENTRHEVEASLAGLNQQRETLLAEAQDTRALLASAKQRPAVMSQSAASPSVMAVAPAASEPVATAPHYASESAGEDIEAAFAMNDDESSDVINAPASTPHISGNAPAVHAQTVQQPSDSEVDSAVNSLGSAPGSSVPDSLDSIDVFGEPSVPPRVVTGSDKAGQNGDARTAWSPDQSANGTATRDAFDDLAFLRSVTETGTKSASPSSTTRQGTHADQAKTLRCTECGTMNFPTEWYCERCGGELAAF